MRYAALVPLTAFFSGLFLLMATRFQSVKEGQNYFAIVLVLCELPAALPVFPGTELSDALVTVPIANTALLFKEILSGTVRVDHIATVIGVTMLLVVAALILGAQRMSGDTLLLGPTPRVVRQGERRSPSLLEAMGLLGIAFVGLIAVGTPLQAWSIGWGVLITEGLVVALPTLWFVRHIGGNLLDEFCLRRPPILSIGLAVPLALCALVLMTGWLGIQQSFFSQPTYYNEVFERLERHIMSQPAWFTVMWIGVAPAVCEEVLFRGLMLPRLREVWGRHVAIFTTGFLFALFHLDPFRIVPTLAMGVMMGYLYVWTRSLWVPIMYHLTNNLAAFAYAKGWVFLPETTDQLTPALIATAVCGVLLLVLTIRWLSSRDPRASLAAT